MANKCVEGVFKFFTRKRKNVLFKKTYAHVIFEILGCFASITCRLSDEWKEKVHNTHLGVHVQLEMFANECIFNI